MKTILKISIPILVLGLYGCSVPKMPKISDTLAAPDYKAIQTAQAEQAPIPQEKTAQTSREINKGRFSLSLEDVPVKKALAILSQSSPVPIVAEQGVSGRVTVNIKDMPLGDLLASMLRPLGYTARVEDGMIVVGSTGLITRTFVIDYLKDKRVSSSVTKASISSGGSSDSSSGSSSGGGSQGNVSVTTSGGSDFWSEIIKGIESIAYGPDKKNGGASGSNIISNQLAGVIHVTAPADAMQSISTYLESIQVEIKRQVLIQAHIAEIELKDEFSLGIDWGHVFNNLKGSIDLDMMSNITGISNSFVLNIDTNDFTLLLDTFKEQGDINMLSSPKVSTLNNQKAVIKLTTKEVTWVQSVLRDSDGNIVETINSPQIDEVGLFLDVTPNIAASGSITMQVHPSITEVKEVSISPDLSSSKPIITVREVDTVVDVNSGQTMVIGGLISEKTSTVKRGIPLLGDIPYLGLLFSNFKQEKKKTELVIFLTPYVLDSTVLDSIREEHENRLWGSKGINRFVENMLQISSHSIVNGN